MPANGPVAANGAVAASGAGVARVGTRRTETPPRVAPTARARGGAGAACARSRRSRSRCCVRRRARRACRAEGARDRRTQGASVPVRSSMRPPAASPQTQHGVQCVSRTWRVIAAQAAAVSAGPSSPLSGVGSVKPHTPQQMPRGRRVNDAAAQPFATAFYFARVKNNATWQEAFDFAVKFISVKFALRDPDDVTAAHATTKPAAGIPKLFL